MGVEWTLFDVLILGLIAYAIATAT